MERGNPPVIVSLAGLRLGLAGGMLFLGGRFDMGLIGGPELVDSTRTDFDPGRIFGVGRFENRDERFLMRRQIVHDANSLTKAMMLTNAAS
jgi:hypothetical protein